MIQKFAYSLGALAFVLGLATVGLSPTPAYAVVECPSGELAESAEMCPEPHVEGYVTISDDETLSGGESTDAPCAAGADCSPADGSVAQPTHPSQADSSSDATLEDVSDSDTDESDPDMLPVYISLGALGATILLVLIINLIGRRKTRS